MPRLMSVALTEDAVRERRKDVTRRLGWAAAEPGMPLTLVRKAMGRSRRLPDGTKMVEPLVVVAHVVVVSTRWEPLRWINDEDVAREGFRARDLAPWSRVRDHDSKVCTCGLTRDATSRYCPLHWECAPRALADAFVEFFTKHMRCTPATEVNRIEWEYVDG